MTSSLSSRSHHNSIFTNRKRDSLPTISAKGNTKSPKSIGTTSLDYYQFTIRHPIGRILIDLIKQNRKLAKSCNIKSKNYNIRKISKTFYKAFRQERKNPLAKLGHKTINNKKQPFKRKVTDHILDQTSKLPLATLSGPSLNNLPQATEQAVRLTKHPSLNTKRLLTKIKAIYLKGKRPESEFRSALLNGTTGKDYLLVQKCLAAGESLESTYDRLKLQYYARITSYKTKTQLPKLRASTGFSLAQIESHIRYPYTNARSPYPKGRSRTSYVNSEYCNALTRSLPTQGKIIIQTQLHSLSSQLDRSATAAKLSATLNSYRHTI